MTLVSDSGQAPTILVVEDECIIRMNLAAYLEDNGFQVIEAGNADEAINTLANPSVRIDLVFSDVRMPGRMDGFALATWLRENRTGLPVILTSGDIGQANLARKAAIGEAFLPKPYPLHKVVEQIGLVIQSVAA